MCDEYETLLASVVKLKMPKYGETTDEVQYTGKGWRAVDPVQEAERLRELQQQLAVRQAEIAANGGE
jgi:capsid protein